MMNIDSILEIHVFGFAFYLILINIINSFKTDSSRSTLQTKIRLLQEKAV